MKPDLIASAGGAMEQLVAGLMQQAWRDGVVLCQALGDGTELLVYPREGGGLVALGYTADAAPRVRVADLLARRSGALARYSAWLPAMLANGRWYVATRIRAGAPAPSSALLLAARELLA